jgi:hypothetical protein
MTSRVAIGFAILTSILQAGGGARRLLPRFASPPRAPREEPSPGDRDGG